MLKKVQGKEFEGPIKGLLLILKCTEILLLTYPVIINRKVHNSIRQSK